MATWADRSSVVITQLLASVPHAIFFDAASAICGTVNTLNKQQSTRKKYVKYILNYVKVINQTAWVTGCQNMKEKLSRKRELNWGPWNPN